MTDAIDKAKLIAEIEEMTADRDAAILAAVLQDDWDAVRGYCKKYGLTVPEDELALKGGIYKAAQACTRITPEVKALARRKCVALGMGLWT